MSRNNLAEKWVVRNGLVVPKREIARPNSKHSPLPRANLILRARERQFLPPYHPLLQPVKSAIAIDATGTALNNNTGTSFNYTGITVGSSLKNGVLVFFVTFIGNVSAVTATWDSGGSNQSMTVISSSSSTATATYIFGLVAPVSGNKTLAVSWSGAITGFTACAQSYTGVLQTGGTTTWPNATSTSGAGVTSLSLVVTSTTGNLPVALVVQHASTGISSVNQTQIYIDNDTANANCGAAQNASGAATVTFTANFGSASGCRYVGVDMVVAPPLTFMPAPIVYM